MGAISKMVVGMVRIMPPALVKVFAMRYIAGDKLEDAIEVVEQLNQRGVMATIDVLGESITEKEESRRAVEDYKKVLQEIDRNGLDSNISIKPTMFGITFDYNFCYANIEELIEEAEKYGNFVRLDIEDTSVTDDTFKLCLELMKRHKNVGTAVQSMLRRTLDDVYMLGKHKVNLRICKGAYKEPRKVAYQDKVNIDRSFIACMDVLFSAGSYVGIATHDEKMVFEGVRLARRYDLKREQYEFQMLLGVDRELEDIIVEGGHRLRIYVPFGEQWYPYSIRRFHENPDIAGNIMKNMFSRYER